MPDQGPAPLLNRAWARRGWASPPPFGKSVHSLLAETTVTFQRRTTPVRNDIGGYGAGGWGDILQVTAHVELVDDAARVSAEGSQIVGFAQTRHYMIFIDLPAPIDPAAVPVRGDRATFSDGLIQRSIPVDRVDLPAGTLDHLEVITEEVG